MQDPLLAILYARDDGSVSLPLALSENETRIVRDALVGRPGWLDLARSLETEADAHASEGLKMLSLAFAYDLVAPAHGDRRATAGGPYASMFESEAGAFPPRPGDVVEEVRAMWRVARDAVDDPIVRARIGDLLYVAEGKAAHEDGRAGARELVCLARAPEWTALDRAVCMARAVEVMAELNDRDALADAVADAVELVDELLGQEHPGPPFIVLRGLVALKLRQRPGDLDQLLDRVISRFEDHHAEEGALALAARATGDEQRRHTLRRRQLQVLIDEEQTAEGLAKVSLLQRAIELARRYGFAAEAADLLKQQDDLPKGDLGFQTMETSLEVPTEAVRAQVDLIVGSQAADFSDALNRLGAFGPPGGSNDDVDGDVEQQNKEHPVVGLFGQQLFGPASSVPNYIANDLESKRLLGRGRQRGIYASYYGSVLIGPMLDEAASRHGRPSHERLTEHFATDLIGAERGERLARAAELFWEQHYDDAAHVIAPRLEGILRDIARHDGITVVKPAREGRFGGVVSLNVVMAKLRELYADAPWLDYLEALLCDPLAINLRNNIGHGLAGRIGRGSAALLVHAACYLTLVGNREGRARA